MRIRRPTPRRGPSSTLVVIQALALVGLCAALGYLGLTARNGIPGVSYYTVHAEFDDLRNLENNADVRIAGKRVGQVLRIRREQGRPVVDLQLTDDAPQLPVDSSAEVRTLSLLGAQYVDVSLGQAEELLTDGATIPAAQTTTSVDLPEFLSAFSPRTRRGLRTTIEELGRGYLGRGSQLNAAIASSATYLEDFRQIADRVLAEPDAARRIFPSLESASRAVDPVRAAIAEGFEPQSRVVGAFSDHREAFQQLLEEAPSALPEIRQGLAETDPMLAASEHFLRATDEMLTGAPAALRRTTAMLRAARGPLDSTRPLLARAGRAVPAVLDLTDRLDPSIPQLRQVLHDSLPLLGEAGRRRCDFVGWAKTWRESLRFGLLGGDPQIGPLNMLRLETVVNEESAAGAGSASPDDFERSEPYPAPCRSAREQVLP